MITIATDIDREFRVAMAHTGASADEVRRLYGNGGQMFDLVREINFYTGSFPADRAGALSSVLDFRLRIDVSLLRNYPLPSDDLPLLSKELPVRFQLLPEPLEKLLLFLHP